MKTKIVILIPIIVAIVSAYCFWNISPEYPEATAGRELAQPVVTLRNADRDIQILVWEKNQFFTVSNDAGETLAERVTLKELRAQLPETADKVQTGLASILAENSSGQKPVKASPVSESIMIDEDTRIDKRSPAASLLNRISEIEVKPVDSTGVPSE